MAINILIFTLSVCFSTSTLLYSYIPSAHFSPARPQKNNMPFSLCATPSDDPIAQIRAARRNHSNYHKKNNHSAYFNSLEHALRQQCHTPYYQKRCQALDKTRNNSKRVKRTTMINHDVSTFAQKYDICPRDLTHTKFNHYEHQLHKEFLEQLSVATELKHLYQHTGDYTVFIDAIGHGIALGVEANHHKESVTATYWADVVWQTIDIAKAIGEGIGLGTYNTAAFGAQIVKGAGNVVFHPVETARTVARGIDTVLSFFVPNFDSQRHKVNVYQELDALNERLAYVVHHCSQQLSHMSLHDKVKFTSAFATEIIAPVKIFKVAHTLCSHMRPMVANMLNIVRDEQMAVEIAGIGGENFLLRSSEEIQKAASSGAKIVDKIKRTLVATWVDVKALARRFEGRVVVDGRSVHADYIHLFSIEEVSAVKRSGTIGKPKITGWHHDFMNTLQKQGTVRYENVTQGVSGAFEANPIINGIKYNRKSFFSPAWKEDRVIEEIFKVFEKNYFSGQYETDWTGSCLIKGFTTCGLEIEMVYNPTEKLITTAYPIIERSI